MLTRYKTLQDLFSFSGFKAPRKLVGKLGDPKARIVVLKRQKKLPSVLGAIKNIGRITITNYVKRAIWMRVIIAFIFGTKGGVLIVYGAKACG